MYRKKFLKVKRDIINITKFRPKSKIYKQYWEFRKTDADFLPSVPHGHSLDGKYKLSLWDGKIYKKKQFVGQASVNEMRMLYNDREMRKFVYEARKAYKEIHSFCPVLNPLRTSNKTSYHTRKWLIRTRNSDTIKVCLHYMLMEENPYGGEKITRFSSGYGRRNG